MSISRASSARVLLCDLDARCIEVRAISRASCARPALPYAPALGPLVALPVNHMPVNCRPFAASFKVLNSCPVATHRYGQFKRRWRHPARLRCAVRVGEGIGRRAICSHCSAVTGAAARPGPRQVFGVPPDRGRCGARRGRRRRRWRPVRWALAPGRWGRPRWAPWRGRR